MEHSRTIVQKIFTSFPVMTQRIRIDGCTRCQLRCPSCIHAKGQMTFLGEGYLRADDFERFMLLHPFIKEVELSNWGECVLNPEFCQIMKFAFEHNIKLRAEGGLNFNQVTDRVLEGMVIYGFDSIYISVDGVTQEVYEKYRRVGDINSVFSNVQRLNYFKKKHHSKKPHITWGFILFDHNIHEVEQARVLARKYRVQLQFRLSLDSQRGISREYRKAREVLGCASIAEYESVNLHPFMTRCDLLWISPQINWDGRLLGCCCNFTHDFGNVFESGLLSCLERKSYVQLKEVAQGLRTPSTSEPCGSCQLYASHVALQSFVNVDHFMGAE